MGDELVGRLAALDAAQQIVHLVCQTEKQSAEIERLRGELHKLKGDLEDVVAAAEYWEKSRNDWKELADQRAQQLHQERQRARLPDEIVERLREHRDGDTWMTLADTDALARDILAAVEQP